jgi:protein-tyrosine phosphatase
VQDTDKHFGFANVGTEKYLGWLSGGTISCGRPHLKGWERITFIHLGAGGYKMLFCIDDSHMTIQLQPDRDGTYVKAVKDNHTILGLHRLEDPVFRRFKWVIPGRLARSSTPHFDSNDEDQNMNTEAVEFLSRHGITNVINLNTCPLSWTELAALYSKGITYTHIAIQDFQAPTLEEFDTINSNFTAALTTLVCGGFGHGRVGTAISALQLYTGRRLRRTDFKGNYVQTEVQFNELDQLKHKLER